MGAMTEAEAIRDILARVPLPDAVVEISHYLDVDWTGAPAVWIWVVIDDAAAAGGALLSLSAGIRDSIRDALQQAGIDRWPYVRFRTRSEAAELAAKPEK